MSGELSELEAGLWRWTARHPDAAMHSSATVNRWRISAASGATSRGDVP